jgi:hypothetical protein
MRIASASLPRRSIGIFPPHELRILPAFDITQERFVSWSGFILNPPDTSSFVTSVAPFTGFGNGKSRSPRAKSDRLLDVAMADTLPSPGLVLCQASIVG